MDHPQGTWAQWKTRNLFDTLQLRGDPVKFIEAIRKLATDRTTELQTEEVRRKLGEALKTNKATFMTVTTDQMTLDELENKFLDTVFSTYFVEKGALG